MKKIALALSLLVPLSTSCISSLTGHTYSRSEARVAQKVQLGTIETVTECRIEGTKSSFGSLAGAVLGGIGGNQIGGGSGKVAATLGGAVLGGLFGAGAEEAATRRAGFELTILLDNGDRISVVQEADEAFAPGDRVRVLTQRGVSRVTH